MQVEWFLLPLQQRFHCGCYDAEIAEKRLPLQIFEIDSKFPGKKLGNIPCVAVLTVNELLFISLEN